MAPMRSNAVTVKGLDELRRELKKLDDTGLTADLKDANFDVAQHVVRKARSAAGMFGGLEAKAADSLKASRAVTRAQVTIGGKGFEFAAGAEFGANRNQRRLVKESTFRVRANGKIETKRARATIVRDDEDIDEVARRVESQFVDLKGRNVGRRGGGSQVKLARKAGGGLHVVLGWNQFRPWRGNKSGAGYWLFPTIREEVDEIIEIYGDAIWKITAKAFPD